MYQRQIAYFYCYEGGNKRSNAGYARLENRGDACKLAVRITCPGSEGEKYKLYNIISRDEVRLEELGEITVRRGLAEYVSEFCRLNSESEGLILYVSEEKCYAAIWSGDEPGRRVTIRSNQAEKESTQKEQLYTETEEESMLEGQTYTDTEEVSTWEGQTYTETEKESVPEQTSIDNDEISMSKDLISAVIADNSCKDNEVCVTQGADKRQQEEMPFDSEKRPGDRMWHEEKKSADMERDAYKRLFSLCERYHPFEDYELADSVKIEPQDIGLLPMSMWKYASNSFLLHGYYNFKHLMCARYFYRREEKYILMVPGVYCKREAAMAQKYGFSKFKSVRRRADSNGEFGYWCCELEDVERRIRDQQIGVNNEDDPPQSR